MNESFTKSSVFSKEQEKEIIQQKENFRQIIPEEKLQYHQVQNEFKRIKEEKKINSAAQRSQTGRKNTTWEDVLGPTVYGKIVGFKNFVSGNSSGKIATVRHKFFKDLLDEHKVPFIAFEQGPPTKTPEKDFACVHFKDIFESLHDCVHEKIPLTRDGNKLSRSQKSIQNGANNFFSKVSKTERMRFSQLEHLVSQSLCVDENLLRRRFRVKQGPPLPEPPKFKQVIVFYGIDLRVHLRTIQFIHLLNELIAPYANEWYSEDGLPMDLQEELGNRLSDEIKTRFKCNEPHDWGLSLNS